MLTTRLLVGADGARSRVRQLAGMDWQREDYGQKGLVCVAQTTLPHQQTAWQRFLPGGPVAFAAAGGASLFDRLDLAC
ncbi:MAG: hypothetical protein R3E95_10050 [Thiolinea sp.]